MDLTCPYILFYLLGIETDALWKDHFKRHFKYGARVLNDYTCSTWREQYFKRNFHIILHTIAVKSKSNVEIGMANLITVSC